jgi:hypothetical protein
MAQFHQRKRMIRWQEREGIVYVGEKEARRAALLMVLAVVVVPVLLVLLVRSALLPKDA